MENDMKKFKEFYEGSDYEAHVKKYGNKKLSDMSPQERRDRFGDAPSHAERDKLYYDDMIDRHLKGLPLSKADTKVAKQQLKLRNKKD